MGKAYIAVRGLAVDRKEKKVYLNSFFVLLYQLEYIVIVYKLEYIVNSNIL